MNPSRRRRLVPLLPWLAVLAALAVVGVVATWLPLAVSSVWIAAVLWTLARSDLDHTAESPWRTWMTRRR